MKKLWICISLLLLLLIGALPLQTSLSVYSLQDELLHSTLVNKQGSFIITYEHSIHKSAVVEYFDVDHTELVLKKVEFEETSVGMPGEAPSGATFKVKNGKYVIENVNSRLQELLVLVDQVSANYRIIIEGKETLLHSIAPKGSTVKIKIDRISFYQWLERRI